MKRVLLIAYFFPPLAASGSMRPAGFCRHLSEFGWTPIVLTADPSSAGALHHSDSTLSGVVPPEIPVYRVAHRSLLDAAIGFRNRYLRSAPTGGGSTAPQPSTQGHRSSLFRRATARATVAKESMLRHAFLFPDLQASWLRPALKQAEAIITRERIDAVFATGSPWTGLLTGMHVSERFNVPLILDFRDPWTGNVNAWQGEAFRRRADR